ncbi:MAG: hypothetical protein RLZZ297_1243 [Chloroflexota bacterium]|jgi:acyl-CoA thioester hydrolase
MAGGMTVHSVTFRARYAETDAMGVVHHAAYLPWLEVGRVELLRAAGTPYTAIEAAGYLVVLADVAVRYRSPARFDDLVRVDTTLLVAQRRVLRFGYRVCLPENDTLCVEGHTHHIVVARSTMKATQLPVPLLDALTPWVTAENGETR